MPEIVVTNRNGDQSTVAFTPGLTLMQTLCEAGFSELLALCGGVCSCATCHVYVDPDSPVALPPPGEDEDLLLDGSSHRSERSRLSCQIRLTADHDRLRVTLAPEE